MPSRSLLFVASIRTPACSIYRFILLCGVVALGFPSVNSSNLGSANFCVAQTQIEPQDQPDLEEAMKYHAALLERPTPGYLYDRFYNTWLETSSQDELKQFLVERANDSEAQIADRLLLAFYFSKQSNEVEALQQFSLARKSDPNNVATLYEMAIVEARTLDLDSALANLSNAAKASPSADEQIKIAQLRGKLLVQNRQVAEAAQVWDQLIENNPDDLGLMEDLIELAGFRTVVRTGGGFVRPTYCKDERPLSKSHSNAAKS